MKYLILFSVLLLNPAHASLHPQGIMEQLHENILADIRDSVPAENRATWYAKEIGEWVAKEAPNGKFSDVDYIKIDQGDWGPLNNLARAYIMIRATQMPEHKFYRNASILAGAVAAIKFITAVPAWVHINWWHHEIGVPIWTYKILMIYGDKLDKADRNYLMALTRKGHIIDHPSNRPATGMNLIWYAEITIALGVLYQQPEWIDQAVAAASKEVSVGNREGIQVDQSFYQHGAVFYSGGYGLDFSANTARLFRLVQGTELAFNQQNYDALSSYILNGQLWLAHRNVIDYSSMGRYYAREIAGNIDTLLQACDVMANVKGTRQKEYQKCAKTLAERKHPAITGNNMFWKGDFMAHKRDHFSISVKMFSTRTINSDTSPLHEGMRSRFQSDGLTYIFKDGTEYQRIFPIWDFTRSPGTTEDTTAYPKLEPDYRIEGPTSFVGGVSDGTYGAAAMDYEGMKAKAHKAWFFSDDGMVALGAGVSCSDCKNPETSINQEWSKSDVLYGDQSLGKTLSTGAVVTSSTQTIYANGAGYQVLYGGSLKIQNTIQTGSWRILAERHPNTQSVSGKVTSISLLHGAKIKDGSYAYAVFPGIDQKTFVDKLQTQPFTVLSNTATIQAVAFSDEQMVQAIFYRAGKLTWDNGASTIEVSRPIVMMIRKTNGQHILTAADPTQRESNVSIQWNWKGHGKGTSDIALPSGKMAGSSKQ